MIFNKNKKRKESVIQFFDYLRTDIIPNETDSDVAKSLNKMFGDGLDLIKNNEWGVAFENISNELIEHFVILDRKGIELVKNVTKLCGLDPDWEYHLRRINSLGYKTGSWYLSDAEELAKKYKYTFFKPSKSVTAQLKQGNIAKVTFEFSSSNEEHPGAERMWIEIQEVKDGKFIGTLDNHPFYIHDLYAGDKIEFEHKHIIDHDLEIIEDSLVEKYINRCFVTTKVLYENEKVNYLYREGPLEKTPEHEFEDSGWRIFAGDESDEYVNNSDNVHVVSLGSVLTQDDSFVDILDSPIGSAFEKNENGKFEQIK